MYKENVTFENLPFAVSEILTKVEKIEAFINTPQQPTQALDPEPRIYGINGLAAFLKVSIPTAQKIKNSGKIPFSQVERTIIFNKVDVLKALMPKKR
ncbi:MAG: DUF3853 family protein [Bacteroidales bacterium]